MPELDLDQEVMLIMLLLCFTIVLVMVSFTHVQGNHGSTALDPDNINGEQVDMTTVDSLNLQKYQPRKNSLSLPPPLHRLRTSPVASRCRLIKVDTEGMEAEVLQGAVKTIKQFKPAIYYKAVYDEEANVLSPKTQSAARFLKNLKYDQYWHFSRRFVDDNYFGNSDNVFGDTSDLCDARWQSFCFQSFCASSAVFSSAISKRTHGAVITPSSRYIFAVPSGGSKIEGLEELEVPDE